MFILEASTWMYNYSSGTLYFLKIFQEWFEETFVLLLRQEGTGLCVHLCGWSECGIGLDRFIHVYLSVAWLFEWGLRHVHLKPALDRSRLKDSGQTRSLANAPHFHISEVSSQNKREIKTLVVLRLDRGRKMSISSQAWTDPAARLTVRASWTPTTATTAARWQP